MISQQPSLFLKESTTGRCLALFAALTPAARQLTSISQISRFHNTCPHCLYASPPVSLLSASSLLPSSLPPLASLRRGSASARERMRDSKWVFSTQQADVLPARRHLSSLKADSRQSHHRTPNLYQIDLSPSPTVPSPLSVYKGRTTSRGWEGVGVVRGGTRTGEGRGPDGRRGYGRRRDGRGADERGGKGSGRGEGSSGEG